MEGKVTINLDKKREMWLYEDEGITKIKTHFYNSPRQLLSMLSKSEIVEYLKETGILNEVKDKEWKRV